MFSGIPFVKPRPEVADPSLEASGVPRVLGGGAAGGEPRQKLKCSCQLPSALGLIPNCFDQQVEVQIDPFPNRSMKNKGTEHFTGWWFLHLHFLDVDSNHYFLPSFFSISGCFRWVFNGFLKRRIAG